MEKDSIPIAVRPGPAISPHPPQSPAATFKSLYRKHANTPCSCLLLAPPCFRYNTRTYRDLTQIRGINWHHPMKRTSATLYLITVSLLLVARRKTPQARRQTSCKSCESVSVSAANLSSGY